MRQPAEHPRLAENPCRQCTPQIANIRQKSLAHSRRIHRTLMAALLAGVLVALAVWFLPEPRDRDANHFSAVLGIGLAVFFFGGMAGRFFLPRPPAVCPRCDCDWYFESNNDLQVWMAWQNCPGCGMTLQPNGDRHESESGRRSSHLE